VLGLVKVAVIVAISAWRVLVSNAKTATILSTMADIVILKLDILMFLKTSKARSSPL